MLALRRVPTTATASSAMLLRPLAPAVCRSSSRASSSQTQPADDQAGSRLHGSTHWTYERVFSAALLPPLAYAVAAGTHPVNDMLLGVLIPIHVHMGFDAIITDYVPKRKSKALHYAAVWALRFGTLAVAYGCWKINTEDKGLTETARQLWNARVHAAKKDDEEHKHE